MKDFITRSGAVLISLALVLSVLSYQQFFEPFLSFSWASLLFLTVLSLLVLFIMRRGLQEENNKNFIIYFGLGMSLKFALSLAFLTVCIRGLEGIPKLSILPFMTMYMVFTLLIVIEITSQLKRNEKKT